MSRLLSEVLPGVAVVILLGVLAAYIFEGSAMTPATVLRGIAAILLVIFFTETAARNAVRRIEDTAQTYKSMWEADRARQDAENQDKGQ